MGSNPINLAIRALLEIVALTSIGFWGWEQATGFMQYVLAIGLPICAAAIWGTFAVPNDPSRSGKTIVVTNGIVRIAIELSFFYFAAWSLYDIGYPTFGWIFGGVVAIHYLISYDRIIWLMKQ